MQTVRDRSLTIGVGEGTTERACRVLEQQLAAVWVAVLESHGQDATRGYRVTLEGLAVVPGAPPGESPEPSNGRQA